MIQAVVATMATASTSFLIQQASPYGAKRNTGSAVAKGSCYGLPAQAGSRRRRWPMVGLVKRYARLLRLRMVRAAAAGQPAPAHCSFWKRAGGGQPPDRRDPKPGEPR